MRKLANRMQFGVPEESSLGEHLLMHELFIFLSLISPVFAFLFSHFQVTFDYSQIYDQKMIQ